MSKVIIGTESFGKGPMIVPTGVDDGNDFSLLCTLLFERLALHDHSTDGKPAALPRAAELKFLNPAISFVTDPVDARFFQCQLTLVIGSKAISMLEKNVDFYYLASGDADTIDNWVKFSPSYVVDTVDNTKVTVRGLPSNTIGLKVIG